MAAYWAVFIFASCSFVISFLPFVFNWFLSPRVSPNKQSFRQLEPYECGFETFSSAHLPFDIRYYMVSIVFLLFDLEITFLFPWAISLSQTKWTGFFAMLVFLTEFAVVFCYLWSKGVLDWD